MQFELVCQQGLLNLSLAEPGGPNAMVALTGEEFRA
jgi:hypothetical protein